MGKQLIIVESPAKVKTIKKFLGPQYMVQASVGHVRDLPSSSLGVDEANDFAPQYEIIDNKKNVVSELRSAAAKADTVYLAPECPVRSPDARGMSAVRENGFEASWGLVALCRAMSGMPDRSGHEKRGGACLPVRSEQRDRPLL